MLLRIVAEDPIKFDAGDSGKCIFSGFGFSGPMLQDSQE